MDLSCNRANITCGGIILSGLWECSHNLWSFHGKNAVGSLMNHLYGRVDKCLLCRWAHNQARSLNMVFTGCCISGGMLRKQRFRSGHWSEIASISRAVALTQQVEICYDVVTRSRWSCLKRACQRKGNECDCSASPLFSAKNSAADAGSFSVSLPCSSRERMEVASQI